MSARDVIELAQSKGVQIVDLRFIDVPGLWQHFSIPVAIDGVRSCIATCA
jgi:glutamine synthetase